MDEHGKPTASITTLEVDDMVSTHSIDNVVLEKSKTDEDKED
jgi:hypothetical protein